MKEIVEKDIPQIRKLLLNVLGESAYQQIERMGGLTNHTYKVILEDDRAYVVRLPGEGTEELINREDEKVSTQLAYSLGIDARLLYFGDDGAKVTHYIDEAKTLSANAFKNVEILRNAAKVFHTLHTCGADTGVPFDVFDMAAGYEKIIRDNSVPLFDDYEEIKDRVMKVRSYVSQHADTSIVPCHNDPLCENWVQSGNGKLYLIDWEYAGMNDAMWDWADISIEADFTEEQELALLNFYFGREPEQEEIIRFQANKVYLDYLWSLWGKARVPFDGDAMEMYGYDRYVRMKQNLTAFLAAFPVVE